MKTNHFALSEQGRRPNNEDSFFLTEDNLFFMVCDGVGGSNKGEIASLKACEYFSETLLSNQNFSLINIENALKTTELRFDAYCNEFPDTKGMATTLTFLKLHNHKATLGHIGDSRIYHIRNGNILFHTTDHSFVNELVASGFLTPEEAKTHPKKNQITRAIQGSEHATLIDVNEINDLQTGDYFMLCTDGILESVDEEFIFENFHTEAILDNIRQNIIEICQKKSNDNFTAIVVRISDL